MGIGIYCDVSGFWIEATQLIHVIRCVPNFTILVEPSAYGLAARRQLVFLKRFGLGVEVGDLS